MSLERDLHALDVAWPPTPDVATTITSHLVEPHRRHWAVKTPSYVVSTAHAWLWAGLATLLALAVAAAAVTPVRAAIERLIGVAGGERVTRVDQVPSGSRLDLGTPTTLAVAAHHAGFAIAVPRRLGPPDGARFGGDLGHHAVSLLYDDDTVLSEIPGGNAILPGKLLGSSVPIRWVHIAGAPGLWIAPGPRALVLRGRSGGPIVRRAAIASAGLLLWERDGIAYRLETRRPLAEALAIGASLAPQRTQP